MKRTLLITFLLVAVLPICFAQEHRERPAHVESPAASASPAIPVGWIRYTSSEGRYNIALPTQPALSTQPSKTADGVSFMEYMATATNDKEACLIGYFDRVAGTTFSLDKARDGFVNAVQGTLIRESQITLQGQPGRDFRVLGRANDGTQYILRVRIYDMGTRIYVVQFITTPSDADLPVIARHAAQFFDSFGVIQ